MPHLLQKMYWYFDNNSNEATELIFGEPAKGPMDKKAYATFYRKDKKSHPIFAGEDKRFPLLHYS